MESRFALARFTFEQRSSLNKKQENFQVKRYEVKYFFPLQISLKNQIQFLKHSSRWLNFKMNIWLKTFDSQGRTKRSSKCFRGSFGFLTLSLSLQAENVMTEGLSHWGYTIINFDNLITYYIYQDWICIMDHDDDLVRWKGDVSKIWGKFCSPCGRAIWSSNRNSTGGKNGTKHAYSFSFPLSHLLPGEKFLNRTVLEREELVKGRLLFWRATKKHLSGRITEVLKVTSFSSFPNLHSRIIPILKLFVRQ